MDVTKPCEFIGLGAIDVTNHYELLGFGKFHPIFFTISMPHKHQQQMASQPVCFMFFCSGPGVARVPPGAPGKPDLTLLCKLIQKPCKDQPVACYISGIGNGVFFD